MNASSGESTVSRYEIAEWRVVRQARLGSTNDEARAELAAGDPGRLWIVADEQTAGRGRHGRVWSSPPGNLYASALLVDPCETAMAAKIGFVAGVALRNAVADLGATGVRLKWPNDLVTDGAKLAGLLVEGLTIPGRPFAAIVGFGVNIRSSPQGLDYPTTNLDRLTPRALTPGDLLARLAIRFDEAMAVFARGAGFARIRELWLASAAGLGGPIRARGARGVREGTFEGLDSEGRLLLRAPGGVEGLESADIVLPSSAAETV